jgi:glycosyltransferase involved in cell wall biosynthesis
MSEPAVSVVIRCRNEARALGAVLDQVLAQEGAPPFEVLALDSGSTDGTLALLGRYPVRVATLPAGTFSYGRALNAGAALARGAVVVYLSAHARPRGRGWLAALVAGFADAAVCATFGRQIPIPGVNPIEAIATARTFPPSPPAGVTFSTANGAVRRDTVLARPFDEEIAIAEDHVWAIGVAPPARIVYVPEAVVAHSHPMTLAAWGGRFRAHGLAAEYARRRLGTTLPWGEPDDTAGRVVRGRAGAFVRLAATLVRDGELRALARLPTYAIARTVSYARGLRAGAARFESRP